MKRFQMLSIILAIFFTAWIIIDVIFNDYLEELNVTFTSNLQSDFESWVDIFKFFTRLGADFGIIFISMLCYAIPNSKIQGLKLMFLASIGMYLQGTLKMFYAQERPYMLHEEIHPYACIPDFGRPSGHALSSVVVFLAFYHYFIYQKEDETTNFKTTLLNYLTLMGVVCFIGMICLSRVFLGVHSVGQILLGISYGMLLFIIHVNYLDEYFEEVFKKYAEETNKAHHFTNLMISFGVALTTPLVLYFFLHSTERYDELFGDIIKACPEFKLRHLAFYEDHVAQTALISFIFGYYAGYLVSNDVEQEVKNEELSVTSEFLRVCVIFGFGATLVLLYVKEYITFPGLWPSYVGGVVIYFISAFALAFWIPWLLLKIGLGRPNEYLVWEYSQPKVYESVSTTDNTEIQNA